MPLDATEGFDHLPGIIVEEVGLAELLCLRLEAELQSAQDQHLRMEAAARPDLLPDGSQWPPSTPTATT